MSHHRWFNSSAWRAKLVCAPIHAISGQPFSPALSAALRQASAHLYVPQPYWLSLPAAEQLGLTFKRGHRPVSVSFSARTLVYNAASIAGAPRRIEGVDESTHCVWQPSGWCPVGADTPLSKALERAREDHGFDRRLWARPRFVPTTLETVAEPVAVTIPCTRSFAHVCQFNDASPIVAKRKHKLIAPHYWGRTGQIIRLDKPSWGQFAASRVAPSERCWFLDDDLTALGLEPRDTEQLPVVTATLPQHFVCYLLDAFTDDERALVLAAAGCDPPTADTSTVLAQQIRDFGGGADAVVVLGSELTWIAGAHAGVVERAVVEPGVYVDAAVVEMLCLGRFASFQRPARGFDQSSGNASGGGGAGSDPARNVHSSDASSSAPPRMHFVTLRRKVHAWNVSQLRPTQLEGAA